MGNTTLVLACIGQDREGLVEVLGETVMRHQGTWLESRMARLGGRFAGILELELPAAAEIAFRASVEELASSGLRVLVESTSPAAPLAFPLELELIGLDRPGIIHQISRVLTTHGVNVEELETVRQNAPESGEVLFQARASLRTPAEVDQKKLFSDLEAIAADLMVDVVLETPAA